MAKAELSKIYNRSITLPLMVAVIILLFPVLVPSPYVISTMILIGCYSLACTGLTMLMGYAGQVSLGQAAFYGIGAYMSAILSGTYGVSPWLGMLAGAVVAAIVAYIVGIPTLKLKEHYLALATLGFGIIFYTFFKEFVPLTGGLNGFFGIPGIEVFGFALDSDVKYYYLVGTILFLGILFSRNLIQSRVGRALRSIHGSEVASDSIGVDIHGYKLKVFVLSAVYTSVAGSLYAHYVTFINPNLFDVMMSIHFLIMVVIGGASSIWGALIGAGLFVFLGEMLKEVVPMFLNVAGGEFETVFFGILLVIILIYMPEGIGPGLERLGRRAAARVRTKKPAENQSQAIGGERG